LKLKDDSATLAGTIWRTGDHSPMPSSSYEPVSRWKAISVPSIGSA